MTWRLIWITRTPRVLLSCIVMVGLGAPDYRRDSGPFTGALDQQASYSFRLIPPRQDDSITVAAVGDIMMGSTFPDDSRLPPARVGICSKKWLPIFKMPISSLATLRARCSKAVSQPSARRSGHRTKLHPFHGPTATHSGSRQDTGPISSRLDSTSSVSPTITLGTLEIPVAPPPALRSTSSEIYTLEATGHNSLQRSSRSKEGRSALSALPTMMWSPTSTTSTQPASWSLT